MWLLEQCVVPEGKAAPVAIYVAPGTVSVGRKGTAIVIDDKSVSREHGWLECAGGALRVGDKASRYGTALKRGGAEAWAPVFDKGAPDATVEIRDGDAVRWGGVETGVSDFRASRVDGRVCATMCGKEGAKVDARLEALGFAKCDAWDSARPPAACVTRSDGRSGKLSVKLLRCVALGVDVVAPTWLDAWVDRKTPLSPPPRAEEHVAFGKDGVTADALRSSAAAALRDGATGVVFAAAGDDLEPLLRDLGFVPVRAYEAWDAQAAAAAHDRLVAVAGDVAGLPTLDRAAFAQSLVEGVVVEGVASADLVPKAPARPSDAGSDATEAPSEAPAKRPRASAASDGTEAPSEAPAKRPRASAAAAPAAPAGDGLKGKAVVFSGVLEGVDRKVAEAFVKSSGGRVTSAVSGKTAYLVVGDLMEDGRPVEGGAKFKTARAKGCEILRGFAALEAAAAGGAPPRRCIDGDGFFDENLHFADGTARLEPVC